MSVFFIFFRRRRHFFLRSTACSLASKCALGAFLASRANKMRISHALQAGESEAKATKRSDRAEQGKETSLCRRGLPLPSPSALSPLLVQRSREQLLLLLLFSLRSHTIANGPWRRRTPFSRCSKKKDGKRTGREGKERRKISGGD